MERQHAEATLRALRREYDSSGAQHAADAADIARLRADVQALQAQLSNADFSEERCSALRERVRSLQQSARGGRDRAEALAARLQRCDFQYTPPTHDFDTRKVKGAFGCSTKPIILYKIK